MSKLLQVIWLYFDHEYQLSDWILIEFGVLYVKYWANDSSSYFEVQYVVCFMFSSFLINKRDNYDQPKIGNTFLPVFKL